MVLLYFIPSQKQKKMLEQVAHFNDLSPALKQKLEARIASYGKKVRYKFSISNANPDPLKENGPIIWPTNYTLDPIVFDIVDLEEKRDGKSRAKKIGMVDKVDDKGIPFAFKRVRIPGKNAGIFELELEDNPDDIRMAMYIELHPKLGNGLFQDKKRIPIITRIDEKKDSQEKREIRSSKAKALQLAGQMSDAEIREFAAAMTWDDSDEMEILRDKVEMEAENDPVSFVKLASTEKMKYQALVKRALIKGTLFYDPVGGRFLDAKQQTITVLGLASGQNEVEQFAEFLMTNGKKGEEIYKRIEAATKS